MIHLIYMSSAILIPSVQELDRLLEESRIRNKELNITGLLVYGDGNFLQVLEGEASDVDPLYDKIKVDSRHTRVTTFIREPITGREFADWSMAFRNLDRETGEVPEGYSRLLNQYPADLQSFSDKVRAFLNLFAGQY